MKHLKGILFCALLASGAAFCIAGALWLRTLDRVTAELPKVLDAAIAREGAATRQMVAGQISGVSARLDWRITAIQHDLFQRWDVSLGVLRENASRGLGIVDQRSGEALDAIHGGIAELRGARADLFPVLANAAALEARYTALPDQISATLRPSWVKLQPEITCTLPDGSGYGGCWHSRITGLLGEAVKVGGVFTQQFPLLSKSLTGIAADTHGWTQKYVAPHPMKTGDYFKAAGKVTLGLGVAGLKGGIF
jgi:hypothetical protein